MAKGSDLWYISKQWLNHLFVHVSLEYALDVDYKCLNFNIKFYIKIKLWMFKFQIFSNQIVFNLLQIFAHTCIHFNLPHVFPSIDFQNLDVGECRHIDVTNMKVIKLELWYLGPLFCQPFDLIKKVRVELPRISCHHFNFGHLNVVGNYELCNHVVKVHI